MSKNNKFKLISYEKFKLYCALHGLSIEHHVHNETGCKKCLKRNNNLCPGGYGKFNILDKVTKNIIVLNGGIAAERKLYVMNNSLYCVEWIKYV